MKRFFLTSAIILCFFAFSNAQDYKTGIGLRGGLANGLTVKHFLGEKSAVEGIIASRWRGFELTGLYEIHATAFEVERLKWYYGFGAHVGFWNGSYAGWGTSGTSYTVVGVDGILGLEYSLKDIPINIGLDWKPAFNIIGYTGFWGDGGALSIRYIF
jgi:hypothetical protein